MKVILGETDKQFLKYIVVFLLGLIVATILTPGSLNLFSGSGTGLRKTANYFPGECRDKTGEDIGFCITNLAKEENNTELCEKITNTEIANFCYGHVGKNVDRCQKVEDRLLRKRCLEEAQK